MSSSDTNARLSEFAHLSQALFDAADETTRLQVAVDSAVALLDRCDHAGITIIEKSGSLTQVGSDDVAQRAFEFQGKLRQGPCLDVLRERETMVSEDLARELRWPEWAAEVRQTLEVRSMMSVLVYADKRCCGALSLYSAHQHFDADDLAVAEALADHLSVVMAAEREIDHLLLGMTNRTIIGRAEGILMERLGITEDQAFDYLRRISSHSNRKLVEVAAEIARTRQLPASP